MQSSRMEHLVFKDLLKMMFVLDPNKRPTAADILRHPFLQLGFTIDDETTFHKRDYSVETGTRQESKSTEKTYVSNVSTVSENRPLGSGRFSSIQSSTHKQE